MPPVSNPSQPLNLFSLNATFKKKMDEMDTRFSQLEEKVRTQRPRPLFYGGRGDDIREYISKVSLWSKRLDAPEKYDYLAFGLRGEAEAWFIQAAETTPKKVDTFNALSDALIERFVTAGDRNRAIDMLAGRMQEPSETVDEYLVVLRKLASRCDRENDLLAYFVRGLRPNIRRDVRSRSPKTLEEAIAIARDAEYAFEEEHREPVSHVQDVAARMRSSSINNISTASVPNQTSTTDRDRVMMLEAEVKVLKEMLQSVLANQQKPARQGNFPNTNQPRAGHQGNWNGNNNGNGNWNGTNNGNGNWNGNHNGNGNWNGNHNSNGNGNGNHNGNGNWNGHHNGNGNWNGNTIGNGNGTGNNSTNANGNGNAPGNSGPSRSNWRAQAATAANVSNATVANVNADVNADGQFSEGDDTNGMSQSN